MTADTEAARVAEQFVEAILPELNDWLADTSDEALARFCIGKACVSLKAFTGRTISEHAHEWAGLPESVRHGVLRLAAWDYRQIASLRASPLPPAVAALWRPWRRQHLQEQTDAL
jgi:hypothetical protein